MLALIESLGCLQIDTLQMVNRSHYLAMWSRLGDYALTELDSLLSGDGEREARGVYEYWLHEASIIPISQYRHSLPAMRRFQDGERKFNILTQVAPDQRPLLEVVLERVRDEGGLRSSDFDDPRAERGTWWDWKPAKRVLEYLYNTGELMVSERRKFQRVYDLAERVIPDWVDRREPTPDEARRARLEIAARATGVALPEHIGDYFYMSRPDSKPHIKDMIADGTLIEIQGQVLDGSTHTFVIHHDNLPLLERAAAGDILPQQTTFLTPFDNLFWAKNRAKLLDRKNRDLLLWDFLQTLEAYKPEPLRKWGYFCLPILHRDRLVGRFDPKLERKAGRLRIKMLHLEPTVEPSDELAADIAGGLRRFAAWHGASDIVIESSNPAEFAEKITAAL